MRTPVAPTGWPNDLSPPLGLTGLLAAERRASFLDEAPALAAAAEAEVFVVEDLGDGEAVVHLGEVDVVAP